ncbi:hypothetical protein RSOL_091400, partial [Rhizoctonia solani AG-3 Rhs1AP]
MAHHSEWYPPGQVCSPPELTTYLKNVYDLKPIIGLPSDSEVVGIHDVMHAAKKASDDGYRNKYFITLPSDTIYTPPNLPVHVSAKLQPVSGVPTDDEIMGVQDAVQTYQEMRRFPSMFDPHINMELSQHLFDLQMDDHPFKLINTPGFDNPQKSNLEVFLDIAQYLQSGDLNPGVKGIIYVHHAGDSLQSRALMENLNVLFNVLLGHSALRLLRILVIPSHSTETEHCASTVVKMQTSDPVFSAAYKAGASIATSSLDEASVFDILKEVLTNDFVQLQIQCERPPNLCQAIEEALGYSDANSVMAALALKEDSITQRFLPDLVAARKKLDAAQKALEQARQALAESQRKAERYYAVYQQVEAQLGVEQKRVQNLSRQLQNM